MRSAQAYINCWPPHLIHVQIREHNVVVRNSERFRPLQLAATVYSGYSRSRLLQLLATPRFISPPAQSFGMAGIPSTFPGRIFAEGWSALRGFSAMRTKLSMFLCSVKHVDVLRRAYGQDSEDCPNF